MEFYKKLIIKVLEKSMIGEDSKMLNILKSGYDLSNKEKKELEEIIDNL